MSTIYEAVKMTTKMRCLEPGQLEELIKPSPEDDDCTLHDDLPVWNELAGLDQLVAFNNGIPLAPSTLEKVEREVKLRGFYKSRLFVVRKRRAFG